jgi:hypothetical protein
MGSKNTSQDPEYVGPTFHEKRVHKDRFCTNHTYAEAWEAFEKRRKDKPKRRRKTGAGRGGDLCQENK